MIDDWLATAERLARQEQRRPKQVSLRRAISTAYYALFHALSKMCADELVGVTWPDRKLWARAYRSLDHVETKKAFLKPEIRQLGTSVEEIGGAFISLQEERHAADYDPGFLPGRKSTLDLIAQARRTVDLVRALSTEHKRTLAVVLLLKIRRG